MRQVFITICKKISGDKEYILHFFLVQSLDGAVIERVKISVSDWQLGKGVPSGSERVNKHQKSFRFALSS